MTFCYRRRFVGPLQAVIFDWAGTIVDYGSRAPVLAVVEAFRRQNLIITVEQARAPMGLSKRDHLRSLLELPAVRSLWREIRGGLPSDRDLDVLYEQFLPIQREVLVKHCDLIPGALATVAHCRARRMRIGTSTGYTRELMIPLLAAAQQQGLEPDAVATADNVPQGRPAPWMCLENARQLNVYPMESIVNVDDTEVGIVAGLNAGMWSVGVAKSGNAIGLSQQELETLAADDRADRLRGAYERLYKCGAHYVIDTVADLPQILAQIDSRLAHGERP